MNTVTGVKFGSSARASNATEFSASGGFVPLTPPGAVLPELPLGAPTPDPCIGSHSHAPHDRGSSPSNVIS